MSIPIALVGVGKIACDQHMPTIAASAHFHLAGAVSSHASDLSVPVRGDLTSLKSAVPDLAAIAVCTPPVDRLRLLKEAFSLGLHVLMEKPPAKTLAEAEMFAPAARNAGRTLLQSWHSRCAAAVEPMRRWLVGQTVRHVTINWLEDVRVWHPGQEWIWSPGVGVFDPGINALSILTEILPSDLSVRESLLSIPANRSAPIAASLMIEASAGHDVSVQFSFDQRGPQSWTIDIETATERATLLDGGSHWAIGGVEQPLEDDRPEYARLYDQFADLIANGESDVDLRPFRLVADAFFLGETKQAPNFLWDS
ncbi:D-galactose 1-dehydrogenase [Sphingobium herbicidovorans NBRC 16415]|uniref:D-galactose 1-dehydrogenase n=1 Tax=Sphingobium herbicidovorans (strain ATCC 700291 / DSM 11019 / CCUG 56400 / KCTC 2939 / LMG 18315 / NBRC 16415 / MH) TaxID=1219045 RepID=A0A086P7Y4_SPHHM|nr:Gfo/Idh/MocA family oxidoreductase [Sphingobium herbicidovorans]KFG89502.1 D-galactose 1-dehydrogenase [Sphingobium herbicidovorans NBRC 16415]